MIAIDDIIDRDSLQQWLEGWPPENGKTGEETRAIVVSIAHRAAMRVLPLWWHWTLTDKPRGLDLTALPVLRCSLISGVAASSNPLDVNVIKNSVLSAHDARASFNDHAGVPDDAAFLAACSSIEMAERSLKDGVFRALEDAAKAYSFAIEKAGYGLNYGRDYGGVGDKKAFWVAVQSDCGLIADNQDLPSAPLWASGRNPLESQWRDIKSRATAPEWSFWIKWYEDALAGTPPNRDMLEAIALIDPAVWDAGAEAVAREISLVQDQFRTTDNINLFKATLYDFKFDALRHVMLAVPMPQDWETLTDPDQLDRFLRDALDLREDMAILNQAFAAEGGAVQGAGMAMTYMAQVLDELQNSETVGALRVGKLVEWGRILESMTLREDTRRELGAMAEPFGMAVDKLKDLIRSHFAHTLARFSVLREIRMEDDAQPWKVLRDLRAIVDSVRNGADGTLPALDAIDVVVLEDVLDSIGRMIRELDQTESEDSRISLRRDIDFEMAKIGATAGVYGEKARKALKKGGEASDVLLTWSKRGKGLWSMLRSIREWLEGSGGGS